MRIFVDTSAFVAAVNESDKNYARATEALAAADELLSTDHVLVECWFLIRSRSGRSAAERFWSSLRGGSAGLQTVLPTDLDAAWKIGQDFPDQDFSLVDRTSFAVMERLGITAVASFDHHFAIYRYGPRRDRAFEIRR
ncbi:MAG: type II toxin-antitoxin system VapC family toxin [Solirubrobacteraceae bacterium]